MSVRATEMGYNIIESLPPISWHFFFEYLFPPEEKRILFTTKELPNVLYPMVSLLFLAYLARRPNTRVLRCAILPPTLIWTIRAGTVYQWWPPECYKAYNYLVGLVCTGFVSKVLEYGLTKGRCKVGERYPGESRTIPSVVLACVTATNQGADLKSNEPKLSGHPYQKGSEGANGHVPPIAHSQSALVRNANDLADLFLSLRGIGWDFGTDYPLHIPHEWRQTEPVGVFLRQTAVQLCLSILLSDLLDCIFKLIPGVGTPEGGSIFLPQLPFLQRYTLSTLIALMTGLFVVFTFQMFCNFFTLIGVGVLGHSPFSYPPLFNSPWKARSVSSFWGARWHQLVRQSFFIYGGYPLQWLCTIAVSFCWGNNSKAAKRAGEIGLVVGTFIGSGFYHDIGIWTMHAGSDQRGGFESQALIYFTACALVVLAERWFKIATGRKVGGIWGWLWTALWIVGASQKMVDAWHRRGMMGGVMIPPALSPIRVIFIPLGRTLNDFIKG